MSHPQQMRNGSEEGTVSLRALFSQGPAPEPLPLVGMALSPGHTFQLLCPGFLGWWQLEVGVLGEHLVQNPHSGTTGTQSRPQKDSIKRTP